LFLNITPNLNQDDILESGFPIEMHQSLQNWLNYGKAAQHPKRHFVTSSIKTPEHHAKLSHRTESQ
jgi:hypothetical protein